MSVDPGRPQRAAYRRGILVRDLPNEPWARALVAELAELAELAGPCQLAPAPAPAPGQRAWRATEAIADGLLQRPDQALQVALRILASLDTCPDPGEIAAVRADLYGSGRGANEHPAG